LNCETCWSWHFATCPINPGCQVKEPRTDPPGVRRPSIASARRRGPAPTRNPSKSKPLRANTYRTVKLQLAFLLKALYRDFEVRPERFAAQHDPSRSPCEIHALRSGFPKALRRSTVSAKHADRSLPSTPRFAKAGRRFDGAAMDPVTQTGTASVTPLIEP
jgi:hypothetical protein